jgi:TM2 domain-containing membrane protein YozV
MTTPPPQPPGSDPSGWPRSHPPSEGPAFGQEGQVPQPPPAGYPGGDHPGSYPGTYSAHTPGYGDPYAGYPAAYPGYPGGYAADPMAPYGYDQHGRPYSDKQKLIAGLLQILVGGLGIGRFYTGHIGIGIAQLVVTLVTCGIGALWGLIDGILILVNGGTDAQGRPLRET